MFAEPALTSGFPGVVCVQTIWQSRFAYVVVVLWTEANNSSSVSLGHPSFQSIDDGDRNDKTLAGAPKAVSCESSISARLQLKAQPIFSETINKLA